MGGLFGCALLKRLSHVLFGPPKAQPNPEQAAAMHIYSTERRRVRAVPTRRPIHRKGQK